MQERKVTPLRFLGEARHRGMPCGRLVDRRRSARDPLAHDGYGHRTVEIQLTLEWPGVRSSTRAGVLGTPPTTPSRLAVGNLNSPPVPSLGSAPVAAGIPAERTGGLWIAHLAVAIDPGGVADGGRESPVPNSDSERVHCLRIVDLVSAFDGCQRRHAGHRLDHDCGLSTG